MKKIEPGEELPAKSKRGWRVRSDYQDDELENRRKELRAKASGQNVKTFVADEWTLEYDLAYAGFGEDVWVAAHLAKADDALSKGAKDRETVIAEARSSYANLADQGESQDRLASKVYALFETGSAVSKPTAAQYLAELLERRAKKGELGRDDLRGSLPAYIVRAIEHVTGESKRGEARKDAGGQSG